MVLPLECSVNPFKRDEIGVWNLPRHALRDKISTIVLISFQAMKLRGGENHFHNWQIYFNILYNISEFEILIKN